jgi:Recombinase/Recombinase zinc beta ribbon domain
LDEDGIYHPGDFNDRLLLGLKGEMSAAELHIIRGRLRGGLLNKAKRGELAMQLPLGLAYDDAGRAVLDPDKQVQQAFRLLFETFRRVGTAFGVVRVFCRQGLSFPRGGAAPGEWKWGELEHHQVIRTLRNPRYAGAYFYGRTKHRKKIAGRGTVCSRLPREQWHTLILDAHPGYISWQEYEENLRRLSENMQTRGVAHRRCPPREGPALLQGLVVCGRCGGRMTVSYHYRKDRLAPYYRCAGRKEADQVLHGECQRIGGSNIDQAIGDLLVEAVNPLALDVTLAVQGELETRSEETDRLRRTQVERARYEAELARRRFLRVDPDNRLVGASLESDWNEKLRALAEAEQHYERQRFRGGVNKTFNLPRPLNYFQSRKHSSEVITEIDRLLDYHNHGEIAIILNRKGYKTGGGVDFDAATVGRIRIAYDLKGRYQRLRDRGLLTLSEIADKLTVSVGTIRRWQHRGLLHVHAYDDQNCCLYEDPGSVSPKKGKVPR